MRRLLAALACFGIATAAAAGYDHRAYGRAVSDVFSALHAGDVAALESMHARFMRPDARATDGTWMLQALQEGFDDYFLTQPPGGMEKRFAEWRAREPASTLRPAAEAFAWLQRAQNAKRAGCIATWTSANRKAFDALVAKAAEALRSNDSAEARTPLWYTAALLVAGSQSRPATDLDALLDEATRAYPLYAPIRSARMMFLLPEWGGDFDALDRFVRGAAERTRAAEGSAMYAWLYLDLARARRCDDLFGDSRVQWPDLQVAFDDMLERHPDPWNRNLYATFACRARDRATTARLLAALGPDASLGAWSRGLSTESCRSLAESIPGLSSR